MVRGADGSGILKELESKFRVKRSQVQNIFLVIGSIFPYFVAKIIELIHLKKMGSCKGQLLSKGLVGILNFSKN
jgi:hypothetical protein